MSMNFCVPAGISGSTPARCPILFPLGVTPPGADDDDGAEDVDLHPVGALFFASACC